MRIDTTGIVDAIGKIHIEGNVTPTLWYQHVTRNGKAHLLAITLLSDIVYWYRPTIKRDESTGEIISVSKKFRADKLQKNYSAWADQFGVSKEMVKDAVDLLVDLNLIKREFRHFTTSTGTPMSNVMYVEPIPLNIDHITFDTPTHPSEKVGDGMDKNTPTIPAEKGGTYTDISSNISSDITTGDDASEKEKESAEITCEPEKTQALAFCLESMNVPALNGRAPLFDELWVQLPRLDLFRKARDIILSRRRHSFDTLPFHDFSILVQKIAHECEIEPG